MADLSILQATQAVRLTGNDEAHFADVELLAGKRRLLTDATITVEEVLGFDNQADTWFAIGTFTDTGGVGAAGDTIRVQIAAGPSATLFPAVDVTTTVTAGDVAAANKEIAVADRVVADLNANGTFSALWRAKRVKDNSIVHISSKIFAEWSERPNSGDFTVTTTGTTVVSVGFDNVTRKGKTTSLSRDPRDPRIGIIGITGEVVTIPGSVGDLFILNAKNAGSNNLLVNGSVTPVDFTVPADSTKDIFVREIRFYGGGNGIRFEQFLSKASVTLTNGVLVTIRSEGVEKDFPLIKNTEDFKNKFSFGAGAFSIDVQAGADQFIASFIFENPFPVRKAGTFTTDDFIRVRIQDNLTAGIAEFEFIVFGFLREV